MDIFFFRRLYRLESFDTFFEDYSEPSIAKATSKKCEVGMARKCVSAHLRSAWQQKPGVLHRYAKDTILKKLFPPVLLRICVSVCELKKSQPNKIVKGKQITICFHVDDCKISHEVPQVIDETIDWLKAEYESIFENGSGEMKVQRGKFHKYLGMSLDFTNKGQCIVTIIDYLAEIVKAYDLAIKA